MAVEPAFGSWIGGPCRMASDCDFPDPLCVTGPELPGGVCTQACTALCPDREGFPITLCVDPAAAGLRGEGLPVSGGVCLGGCAAAAPLCRSGYHCVTTPRLSGGAERQVCQPGMAPPSEGCYAQLDARGIAYERLSIPVDHPDGRPDIDCTVDDPVRIAPTLRGLPVRYISNTSPTPLTMACKLALAVDDLAAELARQGMTEIIHYGTYNCRLIAGSSSLSMHGHGLAIDLAGFKNAAGEIWTVNDHYEMGNANPMTVAGQYLYRLAHWMFDQRIFNIILTPDYNAAHRNHFHVDLTPNQHFLGKPGAVSSEPLGD